MIQETSKEAIERLLSSQRTFFATRETKSIDFRIKQLKKFKTAILKYETKIADALWKDLHKSPEEAYLTETSIVLGEINNHIKHLKQWSKTKKVSSPLSLFPSKSRIIYEPLGVALIIAPWNYPFQLLMNPLVGAISAGCCAMLKASPYAPNIAMVMEELVTEIFPPEYVCITQGHRDVNEILLEQRYDFIFFTGSPALGKVVMKAASEYLTPVVLELGGKSPCIVDKDADIKKAAKRIVWGKTINAGQTCIAPDYLYVHAGVKESLFAEIRLVLNEMFGDDPQQSKYFARIVDGKAMERLKGFMKHGDIVIGGKTDDKEKYIAPTVIDNVKPDFPVMQEEIFGPILPVMSFQDIEEVVRYVNTHEKPLAFYYFGKNKQAKEILRKTTSGGACINDTLMHIANHKLPFGGVGNSGMGKYHGYDSFLAFSNRRAIVNTPTWIDLPVKYAPFKYFSKIKGMLK
ncbi:aldehyde dehydrogenase [Paludibacter sp. 221]|uniref:aldehyde dehydrogenase n=1 Tax=Paludibacter sp. 221 TaxID=2302939 RepID=UPI0013D850D7|nr:aldehyde dehydrogenase [Paludibacter sp. 221]NDV47151.1 aldehyde dehydrogenase [Paludibacter sp. 221]